MDIDYIHKIMKVGICGLGFVGSAMEQSFRIKNIDVIKYDKFKDGGIGNFESLLDAEIIFLCLPTPFEKSIANYKLSALDETLEKLKNSDYKGIIVIKSTVLPQTT